MALDAHLQNDLAARRKVIDKIATLRARVYRSRYHATRILANSKDASSGDRIRESEELDGLKEQVVGMSTALDLMTGEGSFADCPNGAWVAEVAVSYSDFVERVREVSGATGL